MNNSTSTAQTSLDNLPMQYALLLPFSIWIVVGIVNLLASFWIILVLVIKKPMQKDPRYLTIQMNAFEMLGGLALVSVGMYHVIKTINNEPETNSQFNCLLVNWALLFTVVILNLFYTQLSFDRFYTAIFPSVYSARSKFYILFISIPIWLSALTFLGLCFKFTSRQVYISICHVPQSIDTQFYDIFKYFSLSSSILSVFLYCTIAVVLKWQSLKTSKLGGNIGDIKKRMHSKVMKSLAASAVVHVFTTVFATISTYLLKSLQVPNYNLYVPYFASLYFVNSIIALPIFMLVQRKFRQGSMELMKIVVRCSKTLGYNNSSAMAVVSMTVTKSGREK